MNINYRVDIDGLRAIAVLSVLFYHVGFAPFSGGYVGVDVFFVISGYLITGLIRNEVVTNGNFSFSSFYARRAKRLFPSLFFTLLLSTFAAYILLAPQYFEGFAGSLVYSLASISNIFFFNQSGYFDTDAMLKPLLHTWSLSVEEQFYFIWPALLVALLVKSKYTPLIALLIIGIVSLAANLIYIDNKDAIFYLTPFRLFEFAIGAVVVWLINAQPKHTLISELLLITGLGLIAYAIFTFDKDTVFPASNALIPCVGTALVIYSKNAKYAVKLISNSIARGIGLISYSLYLIHWPIIIFYQYYKFDTLTMTEQLLICAVAITSSYFMYRYIEQPFRQKSSHLNEKTSGTNTALACISLSLMLAIVGAIIWANNGLPNRFSTPKSTILAEQQTHDLEYFYSYSRTISDNTPRTFPTTDKVKVLVIGDSQGEDLINIMSNFDTADLAQLAFLRTRSFCQSIIGVKFSAIKNRIKESWHERCESYHNILNQSKSLAKADIIVFTGTWKLWGANRLQESVKHIKDINPAVKIYALGPKTQGFTGIDFASRFYMLEEKEQRDRYRPYTVTASNEIEAVLSATPNIDGYISLYDILCGKDEREKCRALTPDGGIIMYDNNHLTPHGAEYFYNELDKVDFWHHFKSAIN